jgi:archaellum component FlaC
VISVNDDDTGSSQGEQSIDLDAVSALLTDMERDLARVKSGSGDVQALREEVERLQQILAQHARGTDATGRDAPHPEQIHRGLGNIRSLFEDAAEEMSREAVQAASYVTQIGRMLGM